MFMQAQISAKPERWIEYELYGDTFVVEADYYSPEDHGPKTEEITGYGARLSAPGYTDCTEWAVFDTQAEAARYLLEMYFNQADDEIEDEEGRETIAWLEEIAGQKD